MSATDLCGYCSDTAPPPCTCGDGTATTDPAKAADPQPIGRAPTLEKRCPHCDRGWPTNHEIDLRAREVELAAEVARLRRDFDEAALAHQMAEADVERRGVEIAQLRALLFGVRSVLDTCLRGGTWEALGAVEVRSMAERLAVAMDVPPK